MLDFRRVFPDFAPWLIVPGVVDSGPVWWPITKATLASHRGVVAELQDPTR
jgi:hypothetical protein